MDYQNNSFFLPPPNMPLCKSPKPIILSDKYYLPGGDLYILIGNTMFQVRQYFLSCDSSTICCKLEAAELDKDAPTGAMRTNPICLHDKFTNAQTFFLILSIIYNPQYNLYDRYTRCNWFNILYIAVSWEFQEIQQLAMQQIELIDDHLEGQQNNAQLTRRFPSLLTLNPCQTWRMNTIICMLMNLSELQASNGVMLWMTCTTSFSFSLSYSLLWLNSYWTSTSISASLFTSDLLLARNCWSDVQIFLETFAF